MPQRGIEGRRQRADAPESGGRRGAASLAVARDLIMAEACEVGGTVNRREQADTLIHSVQHVSGCRRPCTAAAACEACHT